MRVGWRGGWRFRKAATALVALTLLPVAVLVGTGHGRVASANPGHGIDARAIEAQDVDLPIAEALKRSEASNLFAPFTSDGQLVSGPFVAFDYSERTGAIVGYFAVNGTQTSLLVDTIQILGFAPAAAPLISGATFAAPGDAVSLMVHDEPMALLEIRTEGQPRTVMLQFPTTSKDLAVALSTGWPRSSLSFTVGGTRGRVILGQGNLTVNGTSVTADLQAEDYLALRAVPAFAEHPAERTAVLDAFASGRLAAEYNLVAMSSGGWLENSAQYQAGLGASSSRVEFGEAEIDFGVTEPRAGLVLVAFDPETMPADSRHELKVTEDGVEVRQTSSPLESLYSLPGPSSHASFSLLPMNATVLVVYLPDLRATPLRIESIALPATGLDWPTQLAMVVAAFVVSVAAAIMFRRHQE